MDKVTYHKTRFRQSQWEDLIRTCQSSGLKVDDWCVQNQISRHAYYYWLRKIRIQACENLPVPQVPEKQADFVELSVQPPVTEAPAAVILHLTDATLEIMEGISQGTIEAVLLALKNIC